MDRWKEERKMDRWKEERIASMTDIHLRVCLYHYLHLQDTLQKEFQGFAFRPEDPSELIYLLGSSKEGLSR